MDLNTIEAIIPVPDRAALAAAHTGAAGAAVLAGGTWLFSCEQPRLRTLVDLTALGWEPWTVSAAGLRLAATCPVAALADVPARPGWAAHPLLRQCVRALLASFKVRAVATVGGNVCLALPAGAMTSLAVALDGVAELWAADGSTRHLPVADLVVGDGRTALRPGEVLRAVDLPERALRGRTAFRRTALQRLGRSASLVTGRRGRGRGVHPRGDGGDGAPGGAAPPGAARPAGPGRRGGRRGAGGAGVVRRRPRRPGLAARGDLALGGGGRGGTGGGVVKLVVDGVAREVEPRAGQCLRTLLRENACTRGEEGLRHRRLRRVHGPGGRGRGPLLPVPGAARGATGRSPPPRAWRPRGPCTRCSSGSSTPPGSSAASAPPGWS